MTVEDAAQTNPDFITLTIPAQDYQYMSIQ